MAKEKTVEDTDVKDELKKKLIVWNDEIHSFDFVIEALVTVCDHTLAQAEQCTMLIHHKGKCDVKNGTYEDLKVMKDQLIDKELGVTIE